MVILVTGEPGCGKTSVVSKLAEKYRPFAAGVVAKSVMNGRERIGFDVEPLDRFIPRMPLARVGLASPLQVGKYGVALEAVDGLIVPILQKNIRSGTLVVIDEVARMQLASDAFQRVVWEIVSRPELMVLATVHHHNHPFSNALLMRADAQIFEVVAGNYQKVFREIDRILWQRLCLAALEP